jgi:hypothetical protein
MPPRYDATKNQFVRTPQDGSGATLYAANGAIAITDGVHAITKGSAAAMTLAPPTAADEGTRLIITARTAFAHTVTITEGLGGKGGSFDVMTFAAVGDSIHLLADNLHWVPAAAPYGVVIS